MYLLHLLLITGAILGASTQESEPDQAEVDYYLQLIQNNTAQSFSDPAPADASAYKPRNDHVRECETADYVIVGGGTAGAVIAARLAENPNIRVFVIEAGGLENNFTDIPGMVWYEQGLTEFNWRYSTVPQQRCCQGMNNQKCAYHSGRGLGGSSVTSGTLSARGTAIDFDGWESQGNSGWGYSAVLPYFKKLENSHVNGDPGYHGYSGPIDISYANPTNIQYDAYINALRERNVKILDYNGKEQLGGGRMQFVNRKGRRVSTAKGYITGAPNRPNLKISLGSYAVRILIDHKKRAYGVLYSDGKQYCVARACKEVIVSAGVIGSPRLLLHSGIGPILDLLQVGIRPIHHLHVGRNLQDITAYLDLFMNTNHSEPAPDMRKYVEQYLRGYGPLTIVSSAQATSFHETPSNDRPGRPDIQFLMIQSINKAPVVQPVLQFSDATFEAGWGKMDGLSSCSIYLLLHNTKSRGTVKLKSCDPFDYPLINPRSLTHSKDVEALVDALLLARDLVQTKAFEQINATLIDNSQPQCKQYPYFSRPYLACQLRQVAFPLFFGVGTCKMGPDPRGGAVVDAQLKVHGIRRLRVADASIMPTQVAGQPELASTMIAEKAADLIKADYDGKECCFGKFDASRVNVDICTHYEKARRVIRQLYAKGGLLGSLGS